MRLKALKVGELGKCQRCDPHATFGCRTVIELGCGCALPSLVLSMACESCTVHSTDKDPLVISSARDNISRMSASCRERCDAFPLDWADVPADANGRYRFAIAADTCYRAESTLLFIQAVERLLEPGGEVWLVTPNHRQGLQTLGQQLQVGSNRSQCGLFFF